MNPHTIPELQEDEPASVCGVVEEIDMQNTGTGKSLLGVLIRQDRWYLRALWFNQPYMRERFRRGGRVLLSGTPRFNGGRWEMVHPRVKPLEGDREPTAGSYAGYDSIPTTPQDGISAAEYDWKQFAATVAISGIEEAKNRGEAEVIDLLESKIMQAEETITEKLDYMSFADGTGNGSKDWHGLAQIVEATGSLGGIADTVTSTDAAGSTVYYCRAKEENTAATARALPVLIGGM